MSNTQLSLVSLIIAIIIFNVLSLAQGLYYLLYDRGPVKRTVRALSFRIGLSILLFALLWTLYGQGYITPHGLGT